MEKPTMFHKISKERITKLELKNGMTLIVFRTTVAPKVMVQITYDVGSYVETEKEYGMAHLIEHMIFKGTQKLSESDIISIAKRYGATFNAFTSSDMTAYFFEVDKNNWKVFLFISLLLKIIN
jgi:zinc protease